MALSSASCHWCRTWSRRCGPTPPPARSSTATYSPCSRPWTADVPDSTRVRCGCPRASGESQHGGAGSVCRRGSMRTPALVEAAEGLAAGLLHQAAGPRGALCPDPARALESRTTAHHAQRRADGGRHRAWGVLPRPHRPLSRAAEASAPASFAGLATRILRILRTADSDGGWVARTDIYRRLGNITADELTAALDRLVAAGKVERRIGASATKRNEQYRIRSSQYSHYPGTFGQKRPERPRPMRETANNANYKANEHDDWTGGEEGIL